MWEVLQSRAFTDWLQALPDPGASTDRGPNSAAGDGSFGDVKPVGEGVSEMRISYATGYRVYFARSGKTVIVLLCGGDKRTRQADIARARKMAKEL